MSEPALAMGAPFHKVKPEERYKDVRSSERTTVALSAEAKSKSRPFAKMPSHKPPPYPVCHVEESPPETNTRPTSARPRKPYRNGRPAVNFPNETCNSALPTTDASPANRFKSYPRNGSRVDAPVTSSGMP